MANPLTTHKEKRRLEQLRVKLQKGRSVGSLRPEKLDGVALRISVAASADWVLLIDAWAERRGVSRSILIREATLAGLETWLEQQSEKEEATGEFLLQGDEASLAVVPGDR